MLVAFFIAPQAAFTQAVINEVAWMGSSVNASDEWMELYNNGSSAVDLTDWKIIWGAEDKYTINLAGQISANGYFLLERTNDDSARGISADQIYTGALVNSGENLKLFDSQNSLVDTINASAGWPAGDNTQKLTMEKTSSGSWQNSANPDGTPKTANSGGAPASTPTPSAVPSVSPTPSLTPTATGEATSAAEQNSTSDNAGTGTPTFDYSQNILLNEFLPAPGDGGKEWVELFNAGSTSVNLSSWQIDDADNSTTPQVIPDSTSIAANGYLTITFNKTTLNNDGDKMRLLWPDSQVVHAVSYGQATPGQSVAKFDSGWLWTNQPTPGQTNKKSFTEKSEAVILANSPTSAAQIVAVEETLAAPTNAPRPAPQKNSAANVTATLPPSMPSNDSPAGGGAPSDNINLTAAASEPLKSASNTNTILTLAGVIVLSALAAAGLIYFKRKNQSSP